jgi:hypothetical protein
MRSNLIKRYPISRTTDLTDEDKIRAHYLEDYKLPQRLSTQVERMEQINAWLVEGNSAGEVVKMVINHYDLKPSQAHKILRDTRALFGDVAKINKDHQRYVLVERYHDLLTQAKDKKDLFLQKEILDALAKVNGLYNQDAAEQIDYSKLQLPTNLVFTTNPDALIEEIQAEDVTDNE